MVNNNILYLECYSGISGDMTVSALLDLGADLEVLKNALSSLNIEGYEIKIERVNKCGIDACNFNVILNTDCDVKDNERSLMKQHYDGKLNDTIHTHTHDCLKNETRYVHMNIINISEIIENSKISERAKEISKNIFNIVAQAEAKAHGISVNEVHFHEVGAVDSIIDIVATAVCIDNLKINDVIISELYEGKGHIRCQHGILPIPAPAVCNIIMDNSLHIKITDIENELVTPTGAAIAAAIKTIDKLPARYTIKNIGIGSGKRDYKRANILRAYLIESNY